MEVDTSFARYSVEVTNLRYMATHDEVTKVMRSLLAGSFCSLSYTQRSGKAIVEVNSRAAAEAAVRTLGASRELAFSPAGQNRTLRAQVLSTASSPQVFTQTEEVQRWRHSDDSALDSAQQTAQNDIDLETVSEGASEGASEGESTK